MSQYEGMEKATTESAQNELDVPEGGVRAWGTVAGSLLAQVCVFGYTASFGVYQDFYVRHYLTSSTASAIAWIGSVNIFLIFAVGLFSGRLYDRGYFYPLIHGGSVVLTLSLILLSFCKPDQYYQIFLAQAVGVGVGAAMIYIPCVAIISQYFQKRRSLAMCLASSGGSLGAVVHPIMLNAVLRLGFGTAVR